MRKNPHNRILKWRPKKQYLGTISKSCLYIYIYMYVCMYVCMYPKNNTHIYNIYVLLIHGIFVILI